RCGSRDAVSTPRVPPRGRTRLPPPRQGWEAEAQPAPSADRPTRQPARLEGGYVAGRVACYSSEHLPREVKVLFGTSQRIAEWAVRLLREIPKIGSDSGFHRCANGRRLLPSSASSTARKEP